MMVQINKISSKVTLAGCIMLLLFLLAVRSWAMDGSLKWSFETGGPIDSSPAIGADGIIYIGSRDGNLYAVNPDGTMKWSIWLGSGLHSSPTVGIDGAIYVGSRDYNLYAVKPDGSLKWKFATGNMVDSSPAVGADGTIYVGSRDYNLYAVKPNGSLKWKSATGHLVDSSPVVGVDGTIYVGSNDGGLYAFNPDGTLKWVIFSGDRIYATPALGSDSTIYIGSADGRFYAVKPNGALKWASNYIYGVESSAAVASDGTIYAGAWNKHLYAFNPDGSVKWRFKTDWTSVSSPAIGADGTVYIGTGDYKAEIQSAHLYAIRADGTLKWEFNTSRSLFSSPVIGKDGTIYIGSLDNKLYAINDSSGGLASTVWPMFHRDSRHTGNTGGLHFIDKTVGAGMSNSLSLSWGAAWGDFNNDNCIDLMINNHFMFPRTLYENLCDGTFEDVTVQTGFYLDGDFHGASWGDFDNDGNLDFYQTMGASGGTGTKANYLLHNEGNGTFTDVAGSAGVQDPLGRGRTSVWFDYNNDGYLDLFVANAERPDAPSRLYKNNGDLTFTDITVSANLNDIYALGAYVADMNNDGWLDLILTNGAGMSYFKNNGDATFSTVISAGIYGVQDLALGDYDNDGDTDIFIARAGSDMYDAYETNMNRIDSRLWVENSEKGYDFAVDEPASLVEFDLYIYQNKIPINEVYIGANKYNPVNIPFSLDPTLPQNQGEPLRNAPGIYIWFDLTDNHWHTRYAVNGVTAPVNSVISASGTIGQVITVNLNMEIKQYTNILFKNSGNDQFVEATNAAGLGIDSGNATSAVFEDFDNDGDLDLYVVYTGLIFNRANKLYENDGKGHFADVAAFAGAEARVQGRGESAAFADYNNDGFADIIVQNGRFDVGQLVLLENQKNTNNWLQIELFGTISNRGGIGSIVNLEAGSSKLSRQQTGGMHAFSQNTQILQFGLGDKNLVDNITIRWPGGIIQKLSNVKVNQRLTIEEPKVSITLTPDTTTVSQGGVLGIQVKVTNNTDKQQVFLFATNVTLPNGRPYPSPPQVLYGPVQVVLPPYGTVSEHITHDIPANMPLGGYIYNGYAGKELSDVWNEDHEKIIIISPNASTLSVHENREKQ